MVDGDQPLFVRADPERLQQVLANLLDNALKNSPEGSPVELRVSAAADGDVVVDVSDRGAGLSADETERAFFQKFSRGRQSGTRGTGLGLYICRKIIDAHGGRIWAAGRPGGGATVSFRLPRVAAYDERPVTPVGPCLRRVTEPLRVVLLDNDPAVLELLELEMRLEGHVVVASVGTGDEAVRACDVLHPDVLVADLRLGPGIDGLGVVRQVARPGPRLILHTNYVTPEVVADATKAGAIVVEKGSLRTLRRCRARRLGGRRLAGDGLPVRLAQLALQRLQRAGQRERLGAELDRLGHLVAGDRLAGVVLDLVLGRRRARRAARRWRAPARPTSGAGCRSPRPARPPGACEMAFSTSIEYTFSPPVTIMSLTRSTRYR